MRAKFAKVCFDFLAVFAFQWSSASFAQQPQNAPAALTKCQQCHGETAQMSHLSVSTRDGLLKGGDHGPAIVPGNADESLLYKRITGQVKPLMPMAPLSALTSQEIAAIRDWINAGAPMTEAAKVAPGVNDNNLLKYGNYSERRITDADRQWWAFKKPARREAPKVSDARWSRNPIDAFVQAKREEKGLAAAPMADRNTMIRRAYLDLTGILPTPAEVSAFVNDKSPQAYENLIDRLLASPHYGERWARLWLDVARYADSTGYEYDYDFEGSWRYRDYVIKAFNQDKPYNQFIKEQLAGDELDNPSNDALTATGFVRLGPRVFDRDLENPNYRFDYMDDMVRTTYQAFQGLTVNCARCHDHKFDPITRRDYFKSLAIFNSYVEYDFPLVSKEKWTKYETTANDLNAKIKALNQQIAKIEEPYKKVQFEDSLKKYPQDIQDAFKTPEDQRTPGQKLFVAQVSRVSGADEENPPKLKLNDADSKARQGLEDQIAGLKKQMPAKPPTAMGVRDGDYRFTPHAPFQPGTGGGINYEDYGFKGKYMPSAGETYTPPPMYFASTGLGAFVDEMKAPVVEPGFLTVLSPGAAKITPPTQSVFPSSGRRRALAEFIASEDNPLTARVMMNRLWTQHFGTGIVTTPNNFGKMGTPPSNLELIDWLATEFVSQGWSVKQMQRLIMTSETYMMASAFYNDQSLSKDPTDQLLWRFPVKRLEAEIIRDAVLSASGDLNLEAGGEAFFPPVPKSIVDGAPIKGKWPITKNEPSTFRRSIYASVKRNLKYPMFETFDQPNASLSCERRDVTTVPTQALTLFNNELFLVQSQDLAKRVEREAGSNAEAQVKLMYRIAYSREATAREMQQSLDFLKGRAAAGTTSGSLSLSPLAELAHVVINSNEFVYIN